MNRRVALTGIGCLSAAGVGPEALWNALREGKCLAKLERVDLPESQSLQAPVALLPGLDRDAWLPATRRRRMSELSQFWVIAALCARADARLGENLEPERTGVCVGTGFGNLRSTMLFLDGVARDGLGLGNPFHFSESVANAPGGHTALLLDCRALNLTLTCADASGVVAVDVGARAIREGRADLVLAGGVEEITPPLLAVLARLGSLRGAVPGGMGGWPVPASRPVSLVPGEGAACFVLEEWDKAARRGARPYAEVRAGFMASDPGVKTCRWSCSPRVRAETLRRALRMSGARPDEVDGVVLHVTGDAAADAAEARAVREVLVRERLADQPGPALWEPAGVVGQLAAAGALEVAAAALSLRYQESIEGDAMSQLGSNGIRNVLVSAAAWGGSCMALLLGRADN